MEILTHPSTLFLVAAAWLSTGRFESGRTDLELGQAAAPAVQVPALVEQVHSVDDAELGPVLEQAFERFMLEAGELRLTEAESLALAMHARARAQWSALSLALLSSRMGKAEQADRVLREQYERATSEAERIELVERRAIAAAGSGQRERALEHLNQALKMGGRDAQQMLGRDALARGEYRLALELFTPLLPPIDAGRAPYDSGDVPAWALRGWGLALLGPRADPVRPPNTEAR